MRPYLAVIKDSFRAALASRVLYVMLILITVLLLALAPVGYQEQTTTRILVDDVIDPLAFITRLVEEGQKDKPSPERRVWQRLDESLQQQLIQALEPLSEEDAANPFRRLNVVFEARDSLVAALNDMIRERDFYDEEAFAQFDMDDEAGALFKRGLDRLSDEEAARFNRLMLESGFRGLLRSGPPTSVVLAYLIWDTGEPIPVSRAQLADTIHGVLPLLLDKGLLSIGLLVGILVTAPIIPQTLEPGSISLLLSKPVSRSLLFLSKFLGGCAFMLLLSVYLIGGLWLILGFRLGLWSKELLLAIPLYVFVFAIYYTVSAAAAIAWRNTIMAIVAAILFWGACFTVGWVELFWRGLLETRRVVAVVPAGETVAFSDIRGLSYVWNEEAGAWDEAFMTPEKRNLPSFARMMAVAATRDLAYDAQHDRLLCVRFTGTLTEALVTSTTSGDYSEKQVGDAPLATAGIYTDAKGDLVVLSRLGFLLRINSDALGKALEAPSSSGPGTVPPPGAPPATRTGGGVSNGSATASEKKSNAPDGQVENSDKSADERDASGEKPADGGVEPSDDAARTDDGAAADEAELYDVLGPVPPLRLRDPWVAAMSRDTGELAVYSRGTLILLAPDEQGIYHKRQSVELDDIDPDSDVVLGIGGSSLLVGRDDGTLMLINRETLSVRDTFQPEERSRPLAIAPSPDGRLFAVVFSNRKLWLVDARDGKISRPRVAGQGDISTVAFAGADQLLVADRTTRVSQYQLDPLDLQRRMAGKLSFGERAYRYVVLPVYTIFPKPGETYKTITYLLTRRETAEAGPGARGQSAAQVEILHPWAPVWSGLIFMVVMLTITCVYIERQEY